MVTQDLMNKLCECGCEQTVRNRFAPGHNCRIHNPVPKGSTRPLEFKEKVSRDKREFYRTEKGLLTRQLLSELRKGKPHRKGYKLPQLSGENNSAKRPEVREKIRLSKLGDKNPSKRKDVIDKIMETKRRNNTYEKIGPKISETKKRKYKSGELVPKRGYTFSDEGKLNISLAKKGKCLGCSNPNWKGGKSFYVYPKEFNAIKGKILERDNHTCQLCSPTHPLSNRIIVHHIDYNKMNCDEENLLSVCNSHNGKLNGNREMWIETIKNASYWKKRTIPIRIALICGVKIMGKDK